MDPWKTVLLYHLRILLAIVAFHPSHLDFAVTKNPSKLAEKVSKLFFSGFASALRGPRPQPQDTWELCITTDSSRAASAVATSSWPCFRSRHAATSTVFFGLAQNVDRVPCTIVGTRGDGSEPLKWTPGQCPEK